MKQKIVPERIINTSAGKVNVFRGPGPDNYIAKGANNGGETLTYRGTEYQVYGHFKQIENGLFQVMGRKYEGDTGYLYINKSGDITHITRGAKAFTYLQEQVLTALEDAYSDIEFETASNLAHDYNEIVKMQENIDKLMAEEKELRDTRFIALSNVIDAMTIYTKMYNGNDMQELMSDAVRGSTLE